MDKAAQSALVKKAQGGDRAAFEQLYGEYRDRLFYFALKNVGSREAAEDIVSETFLAALEKLTTLKNADAFGAWLYSIAYNKCSDHLSASARAQSLDESGLCEPVMLPQDYAENRQTAETVRAIIDGLDKTSRSAVILYYYEELSLSETAKTLGISENAAK
ncbi:MAG: RNA polymerase sigma factor [Ruminococcus sp.]|nr:RNA polymerase sigma factor [Ruminococcus sp.]